jgi:8-oxo-dGTP diphosphatase
VSHDSPQTTIRVLAAVIRRRGRVLICRRPAHKRHGGCWEFPGGKLEPGETVLAAARRELREELDIRSAETGATLFTARDGDSPFLIEFIEVLTTDEPAALEHDELRWVTPAEAAALPLAPADAAFIRHLLEHGP